ncbi:MAG: phenylalanine--tRNA ligase subunit beta [Anaerolineae bacterium]|nr:phenylalanine--tRNA ligase subunit beta [Anaerolineae bacterium]
MKIPLSWLKDYVDIDVPVKELATRLTLAGLEVETIEYIGAEWSREHIFVGQIVNVRPHPDADRLCLAVVDYGAGEPLTVVTGAPNVKQYESNEALGRMPARPLKIAFATVGATLIDGHKDDGSTLKLKAGKIRGIRSEGMVCSEKELGLSDEHTGILYLPEDAPIGMPLVDYLGDAVLDFDIKGAFGHLHAVVGIAREVAALYDKPLRRDVLQMVEAHSVRLTPNANFVELEIVRPDLCGRYTAALIRGVRVGPSPFWMQQRLVRAGMRPINNIVDITNYVMLELGQPLHAFDYHRLRPRPGESKPAISMRCAREGEVLTTLDGEKRALDAEMLMITDGGGSIAVGGVMGGEESEVSESTTDVLLEAANFNFLNNRRTAQKLKLVTEASSRFGKRVAPELSVRAAARAAYLMAELGGGAVVPVFGDLYPGRQPAKTVDLPLGLVQRSLGIGIAQDEVVRILRSLEFEVVQDGETLHVVVPDYRLDVDIPVDLVEEVGRMHGYDRFPCTLIADEMPPQRRNVHLEGAECVRDLLVRCGLDEIITYSMVDTGDDAKLLPGGEAVDAGQYIAIRNPLTSDRVHMRRTLLPSVLNTMRGNLRFLDRVAVFEIGSVYLPREGQTLPDEPRYLCVAMTGPREASSWLKGQDRQMVDFYDLKGVVEALVEGLQLQGVTWVRGEHVAFHPGRCAQVSVDGQSVGVVGELHPAVREAFGLPDQPVCALEFDLDLLLAVWGRLVPAQTPSIHPPVYEDLALVVDEDVPAVQVYEAIVEAGGAVLRGISLFDVYRGAQIGAGNKSLAYALTYQSEEKTLTDQDAAKIRARIVRQLERKLGATLRA